MTLSYILRVACLIAVSLGLLQITLEMLFWLFAPLTLWFARSMPVRQRERLLYAIQIAPVIIAFLSTALFFLPQYLANETNFAAERVGWFCLFFSAGVAAWWCVTFGQGIRLSINTLRFSRACRQAPSHMGDMRGSTRVVVAAAITPAVALVGLVDPFIYISQSLLDEGGLDPLALRVVLDHERSHAAQCDNWKMLSLHCVPRLNFPLHTGTTWTQLWRSIAEWAADEDAVCGDHARALALAETLVALARSAPAGAPRIACTYLVCQDAELAKRIERLLQQTNKVPAADTWRLGAWLCGTAITAAGILAAFSSTLRTLPERLLHLG